MENPIKPKRKWNPKELNLSNWFSSTTYVNILEEKKNSYLVKDKNGNKFEMDKNIILTETVSANHNDEVNKVTGTELVEVIENVKDKVFRVEFLKKKTPNEIKEELMEIEDDLDDKVLKKLSRKLIHGEKCTIYGFLKNNEEKMGRSLIIDLNSKGMGYRLVDHRTI